MSEESPGPVENGNPTPALPAPRRRSSFLRHKYARVLTIREANPDRVGGRVTKIPATLEASRARMLIVATKLVDQVERRLNLIDDGRIILPPKDYKEMIETLERAQKMMNDCFGLTAAPTKTPTAPQPVNNGVIINANGGTNLDRVMERVVSAVNKKEIPEVKTDDPGSDIGST